MSVDRELVAVDDRPLLLVLRALGLGDLLTAVPALRGLARAFPGHRRVLLAPRSLAPMLGLIRCGGGEPALHELVHADLLRPASLAGAALAAFEPAPRRLDVAVNLHGRGPQSHRALLQARPRRVIGFANPQISECRRGPRWRAGEHEVGRWCRMLAEAGIPCNPSELRIAAPPAGVVASTGGRLPSLDRQRKHGAGVPESLQGATVIHPGASSGARRWPAERWAAVAAAERIVGRRVLITGSAAEVPLARRVAHGAGLGEEAVLAGRTRVDELAGLVARAGRVLCTDTGAGHLATALGTPSVLLFGPVSPEEWGPPAELDRHVVLWSGSRGDPHADAPDPGLLRIKVADVLDALERLDRLRHASQASGAPACRSLPTGAGGKRLRASAGS